MNWTLGDFVIGNGTNVSVTENETWESQIDGQYNDFERTADSVSQNQVIGKNIIDAVDSVIMKIACTTRFGQQWTIW